MYNALLCKIYGVFTLCLCSLQLNHYETQNHSHQRETDGTDGVGKGSGLGLIAPHCAKLDFSKKGAIPAPKNEL